MSIVINNAETRPALVYDKLHIISFSLQIDKTQESKKKINIVAIPYAIDENGNKVWSDKTITASEKDFDTAVMQYAIVNGISTSVEGGLVDYATSITKIATQIQNNEYNIWDFMALFEACLGKIFDVTGSANFDHLSVE